MATQGFRIIRNFEASGTINQYHCVKFTSSAYTVEEGDSAGEAVDGIAMEDVTDGDRIDVCIFGLVKVVAGSSTTVNTALQSDGDGEAIDAASSDYVIGIGLEAATQADEEIPIFFLGPCHEGKKS